MAREETVERVTAEQKKKLDDAAELSRPMQTVLLDGDKRIAYFVGRGELDLSDTVIAIPFNKLLILLGQMLTSVVAPAFAGLAVTTRSGSTKESGKPGLTS